MMIAPSENLSCRVYNVAAMSFTPDVLYKAVQKHVPNLEIKYNVDDRQKIGETISKKKELLSGVWFIDQFTILADSWPEVFDDSQAREDWGWKHHVDLDQLVDVMITNLKRIYKKE